MAFTVEDGTGMTTSNAYIDATFFDSYFLDRGLDTSGYTLAAKQAAIVKATDHIDRVFASRFVGVKKTFSQALCWPRVGIYLTQYSETLEPILAPVPAEVKKACAEYALRAYNILELLPDPALTFSSRSTVGNPAQSAGSFASKKEKVGPIETQESSALPIYTSTSDFIPLYPAADLILSPLLKGTTVELQRA